MTTIPNISTCAALPIVSIGGGCSHNISPITAKLSTTELLDLIDAQASARTCVPAGQVLSSDGKKILDPGVPACADNQGHGIAVVLPPRGASIIIPSDQWGSFSAAVQEACRRLGSRCDYEQVKTTDTRIKAQTRIKR